MLDLLSGHFATFVVALVGGIAAGISRKVFEILSSKADEKLKTRSTLEGLVVEAVEEIRVLSRDYWSKDHCVEGEVQAARIVALLDQLPELYWALFDNNEETCRALDVLTNRLDDSATNGGFQQVNRKASQSRITDLELASRKLYVQVRIRKGQLRRPIW